MWASQGAGLTLKLGIKTFSDAVLTLFADIHNTFISVISLIITVLSSTLSSLTDGEIFANV